MDQTPDWIKAASDPEKAAEQLAARLLVARELGPRPVGELPDWVKAAGPLDTVTGALGQAGGWANKMLDPIESAVRKPLEGLASGSTPPPTLSAPKLPLIGNPSDTLGHFGRSIRPSLLGAGIGAGVGAVSGVFGKKKRPFMGALMGGLTGGLAGGAGSYLYNQMASAPQADGLPSVPEANAAAQSVMGPVRKTTGDLIRTGVTQSGNLLPDIPNTGTNLAKDVARVSDPLGLGYGSAVVGENFKPNSLTASTLGGAGVGAGAGYMAGKGLERAGLGHTAVAPERTVRQVLDKNDVVRELTDTKTPSPISRKLPSRLGGLGSIAGGLLGGARNLYQQGQHALASQQGTYGDLAKKLQTTIAAASQSGIDTPEIQAIRDMAAQISDPTMANLPVNPELHSRAGQLVNAADQLGLVQGVK